VTIFINGEAGITSGRAKKIIDRVKISPGLQERIAADYDWSRSLVA
jgi:hypothetical protein